MSQEERKDDGQGLTVVAIDKDKGSQHALKWAADRLVKKGETIILLHVNTKSNTIPNPMGSRVSMSDVHDNVASAYKSEMQAQNKEFFLPFRCFCTRKGVQCKNVVLDNPDVPKTIIEYVSQNGIENLVLGACSRSVFLRKFKGSDVASTVSKGAPDFCTVYVISKGKISSVRSAARTAPATTLRAELQTQISFKPEHTQPTVHFAPTPKASETPRTSNVLQHEMDFVRSPFLRKGPNDKSFGDLSFPDTDISFVSSGRPSIDRMFPSLYDHMETAPRLSSASTGFDRSFELAPSNRSFPMSIESNEGCSPHGIDDIEAEMKRLKLELKQTMDMYSTACKEALTAKQKAQELHRWKIEEEQRLEESRLAGESAIAIVEKEKAKARAAMEAAEAHKRIAELEAQKRINAEMRALKEVEDRKKAMDALVNTDIRYRKYTIEEIEFATENFAESRKIGEGGYGPVYRCYLDHTPVAVKVLRPDAAQGRSQFQKEVEVLSCMRHPNMVLLLGACPENGCLIYEYMANGSLEDRLFRKGNTPVIPWQMRFRIAADIATGLLFLHQAKPEPLVHRDLKPANILLDRNYVSKISDVGLARLVPQNVADCVTQYHITSAAGTFCYIDPEYQQTGMLGTKSDIYSLGIMLLQLITGRPPMGLAHHMERAIEKGTFEEMLDPTVQDWPVEEALSLAKLSIKCAELRRKDRPDLAQVILPELQRLRDLGEDDMPLSIFGGSANITPNHSRTSTNHSRSSNQDTISDSSLKHSGYESHSSGT
ncbi:hypothetical protein AAC387_Pa07g0318 [Persea americana]